MSRPLRASEAARRFSASHASLMEELSEASSTLASTAAWTHSSEPTKEPNTSMPSLRRTTSGGRSVATRAKVLRRTTDSSSRP